MARFLVLLSSVEVDRFRFRSWFGSETGNKLSFDVVSFSVGFAAACFGSDRISAAISVLADRNPPHNNCATFALYRPLLPLPQSGRKLETVVSDLGHHQLINDGPDDDS